MLPWILFGIAGAFLLSSLYHAYASARYVAPGKPRATPWETWLRDDPSNYTEAGRDHVLHCVRYRLLSLAFLLGGFLTKYWAF
jgi:hypothetical protein